MNDEGSQSARYIFNLLPLAPLDTNSVYAAPDCAVLSKLCQNKKSQRNPNLGLALIFLQKPRIKKTKPLCGPKISIS